MSHESFSDRRLKWCIGFALLMSVLAIASANTVIDLDLFHEMSLFREMMTTGEMPTIDSFAYTPTIEPVVHHEWGTGAVLHLATVGSTWGAGGLMVLKYLITFALCIGCFLQARKSGATFAIIAGLAPIALNLGGWIAFSTIRATLFSLLFLLLEYFLLNAARERKRWWIFCWLALVVVWANLHGAVVAGMGIFGLFCAVELATTLWEQRSLIAVIKHQWQVLLAAVATPLMLLINPYGWQYVPYLIRAVRMKRPLIGEWRPIWECTSIVTPTLFVLSLMIAISGLVLTIRRRRQNPASSKKSSIDQGNTSHGIAFAKVGDLLFPALAIALTAYLAAKHIRHISIYAVTWICFVPPMVEFSSLGDSMKALYRKHSTPLVIAATAFGIVALSFSVEAKFWQLQVPTVDAPRLRGAPVYPVAAVDFLAENNFQGNLMVPFATGAYVSWKLHPRVKVSIDSRYEVAYPHGAVEENVEFYFAFDSWKRTLQKYPTDAVLIRLPSPLEAKFTESISAASRDSNNNFSWREIYRDESYCIYSKHGNLPNGNKTTFQNVSFSNSN